MSDEAVLHTTKSESFWFDDGDIILSIRENDSLTLFRVHRTVLAVASPVFRDMLSLPPSLDDEPSPVLLPQDTVQDLTALLDGLYVGRPAQKLTFDVALGMLRLSHKYQIDGLQHSIKQRFLEDWPIKRSDYLDRLKFLNYPRGPRVSQAIKLVEAATMCEANELLPTAFYELAVGLKTHLKEITGGLSPVNIMRLHVGCMFSIERLKALATYGPNNTHPILWHSHQSSGDKVPVSVWTHRRENYPPCTKDKAGHSWQYFKLLHTKLAEHVLEGEFSLAALQRLDRGQFKDNGCKPCLDWFMDLLSNKEQEIWENIPVDFQFPEIDPKLYSESVFKPL